MPRRSFHPTELLGTGESPVPAAAPKPAGGGRRSNTASEIFGKSSKPSKPKGGTFGRLLSMIEDAKPKKYYAYVERNHWENEKWINYYQVEGPDKAKIVHLVREICQLSGSDSKGLTGIYAQNAMNFGMKWLKTTYEFLDPQERNDIVERRCDDDPEEGYFPAHWMSGTLDSSDLPALERMRAKMPADILYKGGFCEWLSKSDEDDVTEPEQAGVKRAGESEPEQAGVKRAKRESSE